MTDKKFHLVLCIFLSLSLAFNIAMIFVLKGNDNKLDEKASAQIAKKGQELKSLIVENKDRIYGFEVQLENIIRRVDKTDNNKQSIDELSKQIKELSENLQKKYENDEKNEKVVELLPIEVLSPPMAFSELPKPPKTEEVKKKSFFSFFRRLKN